MEDLDGVGEVCTVGGADGDLYGREGAKESYALAVLFASDGRSFNTLKNSSDYYLCMRQRAVAATGHAQPSLPIDSHNLKYVEMLFTNAQIHL